MTVIQLIPANPKELENHHDMIDLIPEVPEDPLGMLCLSKHELISRNFLNRLIDVAIYILQEILKYNSEIHKSIATWIYFQKIIQCRNLFFMKLQREKCNRALVGYPQKKGGKIQNTFSSFQIFKQRKRWTTQKIS